MYRQEYLDCAVKNEIVFRAILSDLKNNRSSRFRGNLIPEDLDIECSISEIYKKYSSPELAGKFTISYFKIREDSKAVIAFDNIGNLEKFSNEKGKGIELRYNVKKDNSVEYEADIKDWEFTNGREGDVEIFNILSGLNPRKI